jgi:hypothetical protein
MQLCCVLSKTNEILLIKIGIIQNRKDTVQNGRNKAKRVIPRGSRRRYFVSNVESLTDAIEA